jgi:hydroxyacylglutathione hydrolase
MKKVNAEGPKVLGGLPRVVGLPPKAFKQAIDAKEGILIDTRSMLAFGAAHIPGALNIGGSPMLSIWAGSLLDPEQPILLVVENDADLDEVVRLFIRTGFSRFGGYLVGGMKAWDNAGYPFAQVRQMSVHELQKAAPELQVLDVRSTREWKGGHVPGARHIFLGELSRRAGELDKSRPVAVYCATGYRASTAASILKQEGFTDVSNMPGSWHAWKEAGYTVERDPGQEKAA